MGAPRRTVLPRQGAVHEVVRELTQADFDDFARLSGDDNPIHVDPAFAASTRFGRTVAHGMLLYAAVGATVATTFACGPQRAARLTFPAPAYAGDRLRMRLEVTAVAAGTATIAVQVRKDDGTTVLDGEVVVDPMEEAP